MKYTIHLTATYKKDFKRLAKRGVKLELLKAVIVDLAEGRKLDEKYRDHLLTGEYHGKHECHIQPDWLLIYEIVETELILILTRTGSHSDLFK